MRLYFILIMLAFISCSVHSNIEFKLQNSYPVSLKDAICISKTDCFCFSSDSNLYYLMMYYSDAKCENKKLTDTVEFSPYNSTIHSFKSQKNNSYVVLWETEYEYVPVLIAYYIESGKLFRMGELEVSLPCQSCESFDYPIEDIQITQAKEIIEFNFIKTVNYRASVNNEWKLYQPGLLKFRYDMISKKSEVVILKD